MKTILFSLWFALPAICFMILRNALMADKSLRLAHVQFPEHRVQALRLPCGSRLLSKVILKSSCHKFYPRKFYCYKSVSESLTTLVGRPQFLTLCERWRSRTTPSSTILCDIYDSQIWKDFLHVNGHPFLAAHHNLALMLNIDWFRPFKHSPYSVGAVYMIVSRKILGFYGHMSRAGCSNSTGEP